METAYAVLLHVKRRCAGNTAGLTESFHVHLHLLRLFKILQILHEDSIKTRHVVSFP